ncbi:AraC family transcriptional regulator, partial [Burkholderia pseudomallei]|uniref:AraC family transcriptional regulator n=2 Tax=Burkholderia pseudomallei TaxID=28450 RepID=UPI002117255A
AASGKRQAASGKRQAASGKRQAASGNDVNRSIALEAKRESRPRSRNSRCGGSVRRQRWPNSHRSTRRPPPAAGRACRAHEAPIASLCPARDANAASKPARRSSRAPTPRKEGGRPTEPVVKLMPVAEIRFGRAAAFPFVWLPRDARPNGARRAASGRYFT